MLEKLKDYLCIFGTDQDVALQELIDGGKAHLDGLTGVTLDYEVQGLPRSLLFDYCRYANNNASEYFEENFRREILRLQLQSAVIDNASQV